MSRTFAGFLIIFILAVAGGVAWFFLRDRPGERDISAKPFPQLPEPQFAAADWPWWRGAARDNHRPDDQPPTTWDEKSNIVWKQPIAGRAHSSPLILGEHIYLTTAETNLQRQLIVCLDRDTGKKVWDTVLHEGNFPNEGHHPDNTHASSTPATDGTLIFAAFANGSSVFLDAVDLKGNRAWSRECGPFGKGFGYGSSPALWGPYVYLCDDSPSGGWITAIHRQTGEIGWRRGRKTGMGSYGSPTIWEVNDRVLVVVPGNGKVTAYDARDGVVVRETGGLGETSANTATVGDGLLFASSGYPERNLLAIKPDGGIAWQKKKSNAFPYPPTMLFSDKTLYIVSDQGVITTLDAATGNQLWDDKLPGSYYASPLLAGGNIYACNRDGRTTVFKADREAYERISVNKLDAEISASPIASGNRLYIRTVTHLYCIGK